MRLLLPIAALGVLTASHAIAAADPIGPALDLAFGGGAYTGEIGEHGTPAASHLRVGAGIARAGWAVLASIEMPTLYNLEEPMRANQIGAPMTVGYIGVGVGPSIRRELTRGGGLRVHVRLGYTWRWLRGDTEVRRTCDLHGGCDGGFWMETPVYAAHGPTLAIGLGGRSADRGTWMGFGVELAASYITVDRLGLDPDLRGTFISLGVNFAMGRGAN